MDVKEIALKKHYEWKGKIEVTARAAVDSSEALSVAYTPGVAQPCLEIQKDIDKSYELTRRWNTVAVVTDGTAVTILVNSAFDEALPVDRPALGLEGAELLGCVGTTAEAFEAEGALPPLSCVLLRTK